MEGGAHGVVDKWRSVIGESDAWQLVESGVHGLVEKRCSVIRGESAFKDYWQICI